MDLEGFSWLRLTNSQWAPVITGVGYYLAAWLGVHYTLMPEGVAIVWPPNAVLLTAFLLSPRKTWWLHALAGIVGEFAADLGSFPVWQITGFALVNVGETLFSALLIGRLTQSHPLDLTVKNLGITFGIILVGIPPFAALVGAKIYAIGDPSIDYWSFWKIWWLGDSTGLVVLLPALLTLLSPSFRLSGKNKFFYLELFAILGCLSIICVHLFTPLQILLPSIISPYILLLGIVLCAVRLGPKITSLSCVVISVFAIIGTISGNGPFSTNLNETSTVLAVQEFLIVASLIGFSLSIAFREVQRVNQNLASEVITRKSAQENLTNINRELIRSNTELQQFAYVASHDLIEPLRSVSSSVQLLKMRYEGKLDDRADEFIEHAVNGSKRMQALIDDLLAFSRIGSGSFEQSSVDMTTIFKIACNNLHSAITKSNAKITHDVLPTIVVNESQWGQLLQNLLANAIKFRGDKPVVIHVSAKNENNEWVFSVSDQGIGIEQAYFQRIFELFKRLHTRAEYSGTGVGLALCDKIVSRHGGLIWVESVFGEGTTFFFTLPITKSSEGS
jgi:signal transduction histidine kinase